MLSDHVAKAKILEMSKTVKTKLMTWFKINEIESHMPNFRCQLIKFVQDKIDSLQLFRDNTDWSWSNLIGFLYLKDQ